tara:strand:- start:2518 stop:3021 length:504 start_codon:yes stop_codon:yes gene_type:complete
MLENLFYVRIVLGKGGRPFSIYKFRTMVPGADSRWAEVVSSNGRDGTGKLVNDPRITPLGRVLRKYWIDELPQLVNLIKGDLKLIGIRAAKQEELEYLLGDEWTRVLDYQPGLVGVGYAFDRQDGLDSKIEQEREYLDQYNVDPRRTDALYFLKFVRNVVFRGVRSR